MLDAGDTTRGEAGSISSSGMAKTEREKRTRQSERHLTMDILKV
jgi:hypothetical protein